MTVGSLLALMFTGIIVQNVLLSKFLGMCPFFGVSKKTSNAVGMGAAVVVVLGLSSIISWLFYTYLLVPFHLEYLNTIAFIIVIASLVQIVEIFVKRFSPSLHRSLGVYLPLITTNCAVLGVALINVQNGFNLLETLFYSIGCGLGFLLVIVLFSAIREKIELNNVPKSFKGLPIALMAAFIMSIAFMGFSGIFQG